MRIIPVLLLAYLVLGVQSGLSPFIAVGNASPNLMLAVILFITLYAPREAALIGVYVLGLMQDVLSQEPLGVHPLVYAAVAFATRATQPGIHREHWLTHVILSVAAAALHAGILYLIGIRLLSQPDPRMLISTALYTVIVTPFLLRLLILARPLFIHRPDRALKST